MLFLFSPFLRLFLECCLILSITQYLISCPSIFHLKLSEWYNMSTLSYMLYLTLFVFLDCTVYIHFYFLHVSFGLICLQKAKFVFPIFQIEHILLFLLTLFSSGMPIVYPFYSIRCINFLRFWCYFCSFRSVLRWFFQC